MVNSFNSIQIRKKLKKKKKTSPKKIAILKFGPQMQQLMGKLNYSRA